MCVGGYHVKGSVISSQEEVCCICVPGLTCLIKCYIFTRRRVLYVCDRGYHV